MICAACDWPIPEGDAICPRCDSSTRRPDKEGSSYRELQRTVRTLKGYVILSLFWGLFIAPFAIYKAGQALRTHRRAAVDDPATYRQLILLRRLAIGLLIFWLAALALRFVPFRAMT